MAGQTWVKWPKDLSVQRRWKATWEEGQNGRECRCAEPHKKFQAMFPFQKISTLKATQVVFALPGITGGSHKPRVGKTGKAQICKTPNECQCCHLTCHVWQCLGSLYFVMKLSEKKKTTTTKLINLLLFHWELFWGGRTSNSDELWVGFGFAAY